MISSTLAAPSVKPPSSKPLAGTRPQHLPRASCGAGPVALAAPRCGPPSSAEPTELSLELPRRAALVSVLCAPLLSCIQSAQAAKRPQKDYSQLADQESDPEIALEIWDLAVEQDGGSASSLYGRGNTHLKLRNFQEAVDDLSRAQELLHDTRGGAVAYLPAEGVTVPMEIVQEAMAFDGISLAKGQLGDWKGALGSAERALGTAANGGATETIVPDGSPVSGLRGGAAKLGQRLALHVAMAKFGLGQTEEAVKALQEVDKGPNPNGFPQFWDARAALSVALSANGQQGAAELEWADLCRPAPPPPPATPNNPLFARVNMAAQGMLMAEGLVTDRNCEDFETGVYLPCDDAGIPGLGGSASPCALYTANEASSRLWPPSMVAELSRFLSLTPEESNKNKARGVLGQS